MHEIVHSVHGVWGGIFFLCFLKKTKIMDEKIVAASENSPKDFRELFRERVSQYRPEQAFETDDDYNAALEGLAGDYDNLRSYKETSEKGSEALANALADDEAFAGVLGDVMKGMDFRMAVARHFSPEDLAIPEGSDAYPDYEAAMQDRLGRLEERKKREEELNGNAEASMAEIEAFATEMFGDDAEARSEFFAFVDDLFKSAMNGKYSKDMLSTLHRGRNYDKDLEAARAEGELKGKNTNIAASRKKEVPMGDGMPSLGSGAMPEGEDAGGEDSTVSAMKSYVRDKNKARL